VREIIFYETDLGDRPVEDFLAGVDAAPRAKIVVISSSCDLPVMPSKFWQKMATVGNLWELRTEYAGNIYRVLATTAKGNGVILLHAFQKKSQRRPGQDIEIAQQRQKRYFQRHGYL
jgi:phage-related protein